MKIIILLTMMLHLSLVTAANDVYSFKNNHDKQQFYKLINQLRCLVCQNENLADSNAGLAKDLRQQVYTMVQRGRSNEEITNYLVVRYGDFILLNPPIKTQTSLLWATPFLLLLVSFFIWWRVGRPR